MKITRKHNRFEILKFVNMPMFLYLFFEQHTAIISHYPCEFNTTLYLRRCVISVVWTGHCRTRDTLNWVTNREDSSLRCIQEIYLLSLRTLRGCQRSEQLLLKCFTKRLFNVLSFITEFPFEKWDIHAVSIVRSRTRDHEMTSILTCFEHCFSTL